MIRMLFAPVLALCLFLLAGVSPARAQDRVYVQIEAHPSLAEAREAVAYYEGYLSDVNGFSLGNGYFAIALGPYSRGDAGQVLRVLRAEGRIPRDSYIAYPSWFSDRFHPGAATPGTPAGPDDAPTGPQAGAEEAGDGPAQAADATPDTPALPDESPAEARQSEARLDRAERDRLQVALDWAGFYDGPIDGAFGRGTRNAMAAWQEANDHDASGILTTAQRAELLAQYTEILDGLGLAEHSDDRAGIRMLLPLDLVAFDRYQSPFAFYDASGDMDAQVILISQRGDSGDLFDLYTILQTLEIVPESGPRSRNSRDFRIEGRGDTRVTHAEATLEDGTIKGFVLVWPTADETRRQRLLSEMQASFTRLPGTLPDPALPEASQEVDLVSGLAVRKPLRGRSGVYVADDGTVLTLSSAIEGCGRVTLGTGRDDGITAKVAGLDAEHGLAVLRPVAATTPMAVARMATASPRIGSDLAVAGYSYEGLLGAPSLTWGRLADTTGLSGQEGINRIEATTLPGDRGGPVFDETGALVGLLRAPEEGARQLPEGVAFSVAPLVLADTLTANGVSPDAATSASRLSPAAMARMAEEVTVLVQCWE